jgi:ectoine hydroxylase-related dioxygenase (phytanoyl-CoA dioxygenase family)
VLSQNEIARYAETGQVSPEWHLEETTLDRLRDHVSKYLSSQPDTRKDYFPDLIAHDPSWLEYAAHPVILDMVSSLIGEDIIVWGSALFCKSARGGKTTPWHQDAEYWPIRPLETCTVWIAIDRSSRENGCLRVIPGSHRERVLYAHQANDDGRLVLNQEIAADAMPEGTPTDVVLEPGMVSLHDAYLVHGAEPNDSGNRRAGLTFRYMPSSSHFDRALARRQVQEKGVVDISERQLHLVRGQNLDPRNDIHAPA